jgi:hypothetical protein
MLTVLKITLPVFALVFCGWAAAARRMLPERAVDGINAFVFWFALPAMLFRVVALRPIAELLEPRFIIAYVLAGLAVFALTAFAGRVGFIDPAHRSRAQAVAFALNGTHGNVGYLGLALAAEFSSRWLATVTLAIICDIFVFITLAVAILEVESSAGGRGLGAAMRTVLIGLRRSPLVISIGLGLAFTLSGLPLPSVAENFTRLLSNAAGPCALFAIGAALGEQRLSLNRPVVLLAGAKLVLHPLLAGLALFVLVPTDPTMAAIGVLCAALPAASNTYIIAQRYSLDTRAISASILAGSMLGVLTVSTVIWLLSLKP